MTLPARFASAGLALALLLLSMPVAGEELADLRLARDRVAVELAQLRRLVPLEEVTPGAQQPAPGLAPLQAPADPADEARRAGFEVRLARLEEELRRLTGRIERVEFEQQRVNARMDRLVADLDTRLSAIEGAPGGGQVAAREPPAAAAGDQPPIDLEPAPSDAGAAVAARTEPTGDPGAQYRTAMELLRTGNYGEAERALEAFLAGHPEHELAANAAYWLAETHYVRRNYVDAAASFARNYQTYGADAAKAPDNLLKLGMALAALDETTRACQAFTELDRAFPDAPAHIAQAVARERTRAGC